MKLLVFSLIASVLLFSAGLATDTAHAQARYKRFVDDKGRHFLFDPRTGEIVGRANRNARFTRRDKVYAERQLRRQRRRLSFEDRLGAFFGVRRRDKKRVRKGRVKAQQRRPNPVDVQPNPGSEPQVASLPEFQEPVQNAVQPNYMKKPKFNQAQMTNLQVFLDREGFSPGVIDGRWGSNVAKAVASWKEATGSDANLGSSKIVARYVEQTGGDAMTTYTITEEDVYGPYINSVPVDYAKKAELEELSYTSIYEKLSEQFHMSQAFLRKINPGKNFRRAGTVIKVVAPGTKVTEKVHYIIADKSRKQVRAYDRNGKLVTAYPATIGSASTPSPSGTHSVERIAINPEYTYNPKKNFQQGENDKVLRIPPGPNGPVGAVWIALSKPTYGIHGTPNPDTIGKTNSHGCIRLTNWDAKELAKLVRKGVTVEFIE